MVDTRTKFTSNSIKLLKGVGHITIHYYDGQDKQRFKEYNIGELPRIHIACHLGHYFIHEEC